MVVPLKLTQFYGHSVPRPRVYEDVKFNDQRVDPPASVNGALLSWASDAHWSMGGLSFKRLRSQGKVEGSVRRLRAFKEEEEDESEKDKGAGQVKMEVGKAAGKKRRRVEDESVQATPMKKLKKGVNDETPVFVPATLEKQKRRLGKEISSTTSDLFKANSAGDVKKVMKSALRTRAEEFSNGDSGEEKLSPVDAKVMRRSKSPASESVRVTRSGSRTSPLASTPQLYQRPRNGARKVLLRGSSAGDSISSDESDDGLDAFLKQKDRPLRRSTRLVKEQNKALLSSSSSDSDSDSD